MAQSAQTFWKIQGMTCDHCEERVAGAARAVPGVLGAEAWFGRGVVKVDWNPETTELDTLQGALTKALADAGYRLIGPQRAPRGSVWTWVVAGLIATGFGALSFLGVFQNLPAVDSSLALGLIFGIGVLTSVHCVAMCGGIVLSQHTKTSRGLAYHAGRVVSYTILGAMVGAVGGVLSFSPTSKAVLMGVAGLLMVGAGLKSLGWLPWPAAWRVPNLVPLGWRKSLRKQSPFFVGLANGFLPCGPLQTMQLYALGTGSWMTGGLALFLFSLGTVPVLLGMGALAQRLTGAWQARLAQVSAVLVLLFGLLMGARALDLSGLAPSRPSLASHAENPSVQNRGGVQYVSFDLKPSSYEPLVVQKGIPVVWTIHAAEGSLNSCNGEIVVPAWNLRQKLHLGDNVIKFTPPDEGTVTYTCWMGMITSSIQVVDPVAKAADPPEEENTLALSGGPTLGAATLTTEGGKTIQVVSIRVDSVGYSPSTIVVQKGIPARITFDPVSLNGCNSYVYFPDFEGGLDLSSGHTSTPLITPTKDFSFQCGMNMLHGRVKVVDDLAAGVD